MSWRDWVYITQARAVALGMTHHARFFGIPHWARLDERDPEGIEACPKCGLLEPLVSLLSLLHGLTNAMLPPDQQRDFAFAVRPINPAEIAP